MCRVLRLWIAALLVAVLAFPAAPMLAHATQRHDCCPGASAPHASASMTDCGSAAADAPMLQCSAASVGDGGNAKTLPGTSCLHCFAAAVSGTPALPSLLPATAFGPPVFVPAALGPAFVPATPPDRLERPPSRSF